jgi:hypothetical protein
LGSRPFFWHRKKTKNYEKGKTMKKKIVQMMFAALVCAGAQAQVNSGSNGSDGVFNPTMSTVINMADHPDGIYQYTYVNIPSGVTVTFIPNANNSPVTWLVQGNCVISGQICLDGHSGSSPSYGGQGGAGGPGGWAGGHAGSSIDDGGNGLGPGGGQGATTNGSPWGQSGGYGTASGGSAYGSIFLLPLLGGSGGGGGGPNNAGGGGGGGGAICIAVSGTLNFSGSITSQGGPGSGIGGSGSGGAIRLVASTIIGTGGLTCYGGGGGRVRIDAVVNNFMGGDYGAVLTQGYQPIILPTGQQPKLSIISVAGLPTPINPTGNTATPDVAIAGQVANPMPVVVQCSNLVLNTTITLHISPQTAPDIYATAVNSSGTQASSTATFNVNMPHGGGLMYAQCVVGITNGSYSSNASGSKYQSLAQTGWSATGERFVAMELTAELGKAQKVVYITESGKRFPMSSM